jgi:hypothetical protein
MRRRPCRRAQYRPLRPSTPYRTAGESCVQYRTV